MNFDHLERCSGQAANKKVYAILGFCDFPSGVSFQAARFETISKTHGSIQN
jgi:hypothetical protein